MRLKCLIAATLACLAVSASAQVTLTNDRAAFAAGSKIAYNSNFDDFAVGNAYPGFWYFNDSLTRGDVTYDYYQNLVLGPKSNYNIATTQAVMTNNFYNPLAGKINEAPKYTRLAFDAAVTSERVFLTVTTNLGSYYFPDQYISDGSKGFTFEGFTTKTPGEYFTGFEVDSIGGGYLPGITNVQVGVAAVPEPQTYAMMLVGLAVAGFVARRRVKVAA